MQAIPVIGRTFGRLTVLAMAETPTGPRKRLHCLCRCACGKETVVIKEALLRDHTRSCGCLHRERVGNRARKHGQRHTPEYRSWMDMKSRCRNPNQHHYAWYGGRGITYCPEWEDFARFLADVGPRPSPEYTLDRIDTNGNYEPGNVEWATRIRQANHTRRNRFVTYQGETATVAEWARRLNLPARMLADRLRKGWPVEVCFTRPYGRWPKPGG